MKALVHRKKPADAELNHEVQSFAQLPRVGEHFALRPEGPRVLAARVTPSPPAGARSRTTLRGAFTP